MTIKQFQVGKTYWCRSICDHECIFRYEITGRTEKTVTFKLGTKTKRCKINVWDGVETIKPQGTYSMCQILTAEKVSA